MHVTKAGSGSRALVTNWECETEKASSWQRRFKVGGGGFKDGTERDT